MEGRRGRGQQGWPPAGKRGVWRGLGEAAVALEFNWDQINILSFWLSYPEAFVFPLPSSHLSI